MRARSTPTAAASRRGALLRKAEYATSRAILGHPGCNGGMRLRALWSVATRDGITAFARGLQGLGVELYASDGTREHLAQDGVEAQPVAALPGLAKFLGGKVETFHPSVYAGIRARRDMPEQLAELETQGIGLIDLVIVNVRP